MEQVLFLVLQKALFTQPKHTYFTKIGGKICANTGVQKENSTQIIKFFYLLFLTVGTLLWFRVYQTHFPFQYGPVIKLPLQILPSLHGQPYEIASIPSVGGVGVSTRDGEFSTCHSSQ